ncbi:MAG TPA: choice-of-anchor tandem repeat NxxGxxAF-containing protein [Chthoniobacteraceae bacterium]|jgi:hypothetical protein|nr:choice-of-anchor tandem repeat NxxGxxAF-containing protein [Chthoniobacteraceae bacterium]
MFSSCLAFFRWRFIALAAALFLSAAPGWSAVLRVKGDAAGANNGSSWTDAYRELVSAIAAAQVGDEIWVARGIYYPDFDSASGTHTGNRDLRFQLKTDVKLFGGFAGTETARSPRDFAANRTILSGDIGQPGVFSDNTRTIAYSATGATGIVVEGFVFAGGNANDPRELGGGIVGGSGGAIYLKGAVAEIRHCSFVGNFAVYGGAMVAEGNPGSTLAVTNCLFANNTATYVGGAILFQASAGQFTVGNCTVVNNSSSRGAAIGTNTGVTCAYFNNIIFGNTATSSGWQKVETGSQSTNENNILEEALVPAGTNNLVVAAVGFSMTPAVGPDGRWGTMDDILDASLVASSPAIRFGATNRLAADTTDLDGDGDTTEAIPFDLLHQPRVSPGPPDAGAFEYALDLTQLPALTLPAPGTAMAHSIAIAFNLPEAALAGSVKLTFDSATTTRILTLATDQESAGDHAFTFDPAGPVGPAIVSGSAIPDGVYTVRISYQDAAGHPVASAESANVRVDTAGPVGGNMLLLPLDTMYAAGATVGVYFTNWTDAGGQTPLSYQLLVDGVPSAVPGARPDFNFTIPSGVGVHTLLGRVRDALGNVGAVSLEITVGVAPAVGPVTVNEITSTGAALSTQVATGGLPTKVSFYVNGADAGTVDVPASNGLIGLDGTPAPQTASLVLTGLTPATTYEVQPWVWNLAGSTTAAATTFKTAGVLPPEPVSTPVYSALGPVPGAGLTPGGVPGGSVFLYFGQSSINAGGEVAALATMAAPTGRFTGIVLSSAGVIARSGGNAPGQDGKFVKFEEPLLNAQGTLVFEAVLSGPAAHAGSLWKRLPGALQPTLVARAGQDAPGASGGHWKSFDSVALSDGVPGDELLAFTATLQTGGRGLPTTANDTGLWLAKGGAAPLLALREGAPLAVDGPGVRVPRIKLFSTLNAMPVANGQGRGATAGGVLVRVILDDWRTALVQVSIANGQVKTEVIALVGAPLPGVAAKLTQIGWTAQDGAGHAGFVAVYADPVTRLLKSHVIREGSAGLSVLANQGDQPIAGEQSAITVFDALALAQDTNGEGQAAVAAHLRGGVTTAAKDGVILMYRPGQPAQVVAREGDEAADLPGARWAGFPSVALADGASGPVFIGKLLISPRTPLATERVTAANNLGVWAVDSHGRLRLIARTGDSYDATRTISALTLLGNVAGSPAQTRSVAPNGHVLYRATLSDRSQALVQVQLP